MTANGRGLGPSIRTEGGLVPADLLARVAANDPEVPGLTLAAYHLDAGLRFGEAITSSWNRLIGAWSAFQADRAVLPVSDPGTTATRERWLLPLFDELGYGRLQRATAIEITGKTYPVSHAWGAVPIHLIGCRVALDRRTERVAGAAGQAPHALVQELLNRSPERLWGFVSNGLSLRILRDNATLTRQAYVEFDVEAIFDGEAYADFALLWLVAHQSRVEGENPEACWLEKWTTFAAEAGTRALDKLRAGVEAAISALGRGFLSHPANSELRDALRDGVLNKQDYYRELLRLVYRLLFMFAAEDRGLLLDPNADEPIQQRYLVYYSTARLRRLAERRKGSRHADVWAGLKVVMAALGSDTGAVGLALPALGGFLFSGDACPRLDRAELANRDLLEAVRALATIEDGRVRRSVDYRNLGAEELGGVYESLLELHPELDATAGSFALRTVAGHERQTTGSYYTPTSLINVLLDTALDPVLAEAAAQTDPERAILNLKVVDPAAGSGHFLVAASHRIAKKLATVRTGDGEPSPRAVRTALRDVIGRCMYAVDVNPMAVELCKVSLWLEAIEPGKPLSFLDAHIKTGNSLLGITPDVMGDGIPDAAYQPIRGDVSATARELKNRNRAERDGQLTFDEAPISLHSADLATAARSVDQVSDDAIEGVQAKASRFDEFLHSRKYREAKLVADSWCAAFVVAKRAEAPAITTSVIRQISRDLEGAKSATVGEIVRLADEYRFFHWPIEFPGIFADGGGFDVVLGNPPWDRVKLQEQEFFAERSPAIAAAATAAARKRMIAALEVEDETLWGEFNRALRRAEGESHLLRDSGRYPYTGRGDINTYAVFAETFRTLVGRTGRAGLIVPTGIATDDTTRFFFRDLVDKRSLASLHGFENEEFVFPGIAHTVKFCLLTLAGSSRPIDSADFMFFARQATDVADDHRHFTLTQADFELLNPNTRTSPIFRSRLDAELTKAVYRRVPVLWDESSGDDGNRWRMSFTSGFHMSMDSGLFRTGSQLEADGWQLSGNIYRRGRDEYLPLYEAKMALFFDHRFGDFSMHVVTDQSKGIRALPTVPIESLGRPEYSPLPRYWVPAAEVVARLHGRWPYKWLLGWREVTSAVLVRTLSPSLIPAYATSNKILLALPDQPARLIACLFANLASFAVDFIARQKLGGNSFSYFYFKQIPVLDPTTYERETPWEPSRSLVDWIVQRVVELSYTAYDLKAFASDVGWEGPPFQWSEDRRLRLRAELDAAFMHLYGYDRDQVDYILDTFWVVRDRDAREHGSYRTKQLILEAYDAMGVATPERPFASRLVPGPGDPEAAHQPTSDEGPGRWVRSADVERAIQRGSVPKIGRRDQPGKKAVPEPGVVHVRQVDPRLGYPEAVPGFRRSAESETPAPAGTRHPSQATLSDLTRESAASGDWLPEEAVDVAGIVPGRRVRHRRFGEGVVVEVRRTVKVPVVTIRFGGSDDREIAIGYGLIEFEV
jgi:hypothetical protein